MFFFIDQHPHAFEFWKHQEIFVGGKLQWAVAISLEAYGKFHLRDFIDDFDVFFVLLGAVEVFYIAIASFENTIRELISSHLLEEKKADWWNLCVSSDIRKRAEQKMKEEQQIRWHQARGLNPIYFTELKDLTSIIQQNWSSFEALLHDMDWVRHLIRTIERSRNVIMHSGQLAIDDVERIGMNIRDWIRQVGG